MPKHSPLHLCQLVHRPCDLLRTQALHLTQKDPQQITHWLKGK